MPSQDSDISRELPTTQPRESALRTLIIARRILDQARPLCSAEDSHDASAGLVRLHDAVELVLHGAALQLGIDHGSGPPRVEFNKLLDFVRTEVDVPRSMTIRNLNKERVQVKHYGHIAAPETVQRFLRAAEEMTEGVLRAVYGQSLTQITLLDLLPRDCPGRLYLHDASRALAEGDVKAALTGVAQALFVEVLVEYSVDPNENVDPDKTIDCGARGSKAPAHTKKSEWIRTMIKHPAQYVQIDMARLRGDLLEWGASIREFENVRLNTPDAVLLTNGEWMYAWLTALETRLNVRSASYCLSATAALIAKKWKHLLSRQHPGGPELWTLVRLQRDHCLLYRAELDSSLGEQLREGDVVKVAHFVTGFDGCEYADVVHFDDSLPSSLLLGYLPRDACEVLPPEDSNDN